MEIIRIFIFLMSLYYFTLYQVFMGLMCVGTYLYYRNRKQMLIDTNNLFMYICVDKIDDLVMILNICGMYLKNKFPFNFIYSYLNILNGYYVNLKRKVFFYLIGKIFQLFFKSNNQLPVQIPVQTNTKNKKHRDILKTDIEINDFLDKLQHST